MSDDDLSGLAGKYKKMGSCLYLFPASNPTHEALISAHGGYYKATKMFKVPRGMTIYFWAPHGYVLNDPGVKLMYTSKNNEAVEKRDGGEECIDYALSKYQGSHGGKPGNPAETYTSIASQIEDEDNRLTRCLQRLDAATSDKAREGALAQIAASGAMNVITVRNRSLRGDVYLSSLVESVRKHAPEITTLHCSFCRCLMTSKSDPTWNVTTGHTGFS